MISSGVRVWFKFVSVGYQADVLSYCLHSAVVTLTNTIYFSGHDHKVVYGFLNTTAIYLAQSYVVHIIFM